MTCRDWEEQIALDAGGDLAETGELERHLGECPACRETAAEYRKGLAPAHYAAVRARVLAELRQERRRLWRRIWVSGLTAAAVVGLMLLFPRPARTPPVGRASRPALPQRNVSRQQPQAAISSPRHPARGPLPRGRGSRERPGNGRSTEPLVVKLLTDDPNVIIYWIVDQKGE